MKAFLAQADQPIPRTHSLEDLLALCGAVAPAWNALEVDVTTLTPFAVELRYDFDFWPDEETAREAVTIAGRVREALVRVLAVGRT